MPMSATGNRSAGYTLTEILVVVFIMGLAAGSVVLALPESRSGLHDEALAFAARMELAAQESVMTGEIVGVTVSDADYGFYRYRRGRWLAMGRDSSFAPARWSDGTAVFIEREGTALDKLAGSENRPDRIIPAIRFEPIGAATPFSVILSDEDEEFRITGDAAGTITFEERGDG